MKYLFSKNSYYKTIILLCCICFSVLITGCSDSSSNSDGITLSTTEQASLAEFNGSRMQWYQKK